MKIISIPAGQFIDAYLKRNREPDTVFKLGGGTYYTGGAFGFEEFDCCMLAPGCTLQGEGSFRTRLELMNPKLEHSGKSTNYVEALTGGARTEGSSSSIRIQGLRLSMPYIAVPTIGVHVWSSGVGIYDVEVEDVFGDRDWPTTPKEGFGILVNNSYECYGKFEGGNSIKQCRVSMRWTSSENYSTGLYMGTVRGQRPLLRSSIEDCEVVADDAHCGLAFNDHVDVERNHVHGVRRAIFADTAPIRNSRVAGLCAHDCGVAIELRTSGPADIRKGILIEKSFFSFKPVSHWSQAILLCDDSNENAGPIEGVVVKDCVFVKGADGSASKGRSHGKKIQAVATAGNFWLGDWQAPVDQEGAGKWV